MALKPYKCGSCGRFLCLEDLKEGKIIIKCHSCKKLNTLTSEREYSNLLDKENQ